MAESLIQTLPAGRTDEDRRERFNNMVAILVALISAFLAVSNVKNGNIVQAIQRSQALLTDSWNQYQAKRMRQFELELEVRRAQALSRDGVLKDTPENRSLLASWQAEIERYKGELQDLTMQARAHEAEYKRLNDTDDVFDLSDSFLSLALALLAIAALTRIPWLLALAAGVSLVGLGFGTAGFAGVTDVKPDWLMVLLAA